jgi:hypothetical protein
MTSMPKSKKTAHNSYILRGMARGPWASQWANEQEEQGVRFPGGTDIYEVAPEAPKWAEKWARGIADAIVSLNGQSLDSLYEVARSVGFTKDEEAFGFYLGMQAVGHGVAWDDDFATDFKIKVPSSELYEGAKPDLRFISE